MTGPRFCRGRGCPSPGTHRAAVDLSSVASAQIMQQMLTATEKDLTDDLKGLVRLN